MSHSIECQINMTGYSTRSNIVNWGFQDSTIMARRGCMMLIKLFKISKYDFKVLTALVVAVVMRAIDHWKM